MTSSTAAGRRSTTARILGSLGILSTAVALSGLTTLGSFTASTSVSTTVTSGILSLDVGVPGGVKHVIPVTTAGFAPGDSLSRPLNLENKGDVALSSLRLATTAAPASVLVTDPVNGLQLALEQCSRRWTEGGTATAPTYTCEGTRRTLYSGPLVSTADLPSPNSLVPGGTDHLVFTISLPTAAGNEFQTLSADVTLVFTGIQAPGRER